MGPYPVWAFNFDPSEEKAFLNGDWNRVINALEKEDAMVADPVARLLMGHASLATNRNNAAALLFLSVRKPADLKKWSQWAEKFLGTRPRNPVANYLATDALARNGKIDRAIDGFTKVLEVKPNFALARNARECSTWPKILWGRVEHWCIHGDALERFNARIYHGP